MVNMVVNIHSSCVQGVFKLVRDKLSKKSVVREERPPNNKDEELEQWVRQFRVERTSMLRDMGKNFASVPGWHSITIPCTDRREHMEVIMDHMVVGHVHYDQKNRNSRMIAVLSRGNVGVEG